VTEADQIIPALKQAASYTDGPTIIEFMINYEDIVLPMVRSGNPTYDMIL
jgi:acetolactate synthase-1/2/3 large subunit